MHKITQLGSHGVESINHLRPWHFAEMTFSRNLMVPKGDSGGIN